MCIHVNYFKIASRISSASHKLFLVGDKKVEGTLDAKVFRCLGAECPNCDKQLYIRVILGGKDAYCTECGNEFELTSSGKISIKGSLNDLLHVDDLYEIPPTKCTGCNNKITTVVNTLGDNEFNHCYCGENFE